MTSARQVIVAGAGIGGLTAALALARNDFQVVVLEQAERLEETGAGIQLSPNATRLLIALGLGEKLRPHAVAPQALRVLNADNGREIVRMAIGAPAEQRYGAPYWSIHRGDLQATLAAAVAEQPSITLKLGMRLEDFADDAGGMTASVKGPAGLYEERGVALLAADGLWSMARTRLGDAAPPRFAGRIAWRALVPASKVAPEFREPLIQLWLGRGAHLVHYPVKGGSVINVVAITDDAWSGTGWSEPANHFEVVPRFARWAPQAQSLIGLPEAWLKWALYDRAPLPHWSRRSVALLGDAAHPMLPYLAQGAAMAIEDAVVSAQCLARMPDNAAAALQIYETMRRARAGKVQGLAARNGARYHQTGFRSAVQNVALRIMGGARLLRHYDWLYDWRPPPILPAD